MIARNVEIAPCIEHEERVFMCLCTMGVGSLTSYMMHIFQKESEKNWAAKQHRKLRHLDFFFPFDFLINWIIRMQPESEL